MKKSLKAALAAGTGAALLLGGAGTLAYWTTEGTAPGDNISSGEILLSEPDCDPDADTYEWTLNGVGVNIASVKIVPGDTLVKICEFEITASGDNFEGTVTTTGGTDSGALAAKVDTTSSYTVDGVARSTVSHDDDGKVLKATMEVDFPIGLTIDDSSQGLAGALDDYVFTVTQDH